MSDLLRLFGVLGLLAVAYLMATAFNAVLTWAWRRFHR
jgi:hypothetical protein